MHLKITGQKTKDFYDKQQTAKQKENFEDKSLSNCLKAKMATQKYDVVSLLWQILKNLEKSIVKRVAIKNQKGKIISLKIEKIKFKITDLSLVPNTSNSILLDSKVTCNSHVYHF